VGSKNRGKGGKGERSLRGNGEERRTKPFPTQGGRGQAGRPIPGRQSDFGLLSGGREKYQGGHGKKKGKLEATLESKVFRKSNMGGGEGGADGKNVTKKGDVKKSLSERVDAGD